MTAQKGRTYDRTVPVAPSFEKALASGAVPHMRDAKIKPLVETFNRSMLATYGELCGWALARAHGRASHPWLISGYLGTSDTFDKAMGDFAIAYADQTERDHAALKAAVGAGRIGVHIEEES